MRPFRMIIVLLTILLISGICFAEPKKDKSVVPFPTYDGEYNPGIFSNDYFALSSAINTPGIETQIVINIEGKEPLYAIRVIQITGNQADGGRTFILLRYFYLDKELKLCSFAFNALFNTYKELTMTPEGKMALRKALLMIYFPQKAPPKPHGYPGGKATNV